MSLGREFESECNDIAVDILTNYEGFERVEKGPDLSGTPFDFFGYKDGAPYTIELKSSLKNFQSSTRTQKSRMQKVLKRIDGLNIALLQLKLKERQYRILYNEEMNHLFKGREASFKPILNWLRRRLR